MTFSEMANSVFERAVADYHRKDEIEGEYLSPYTPGSLEEKLYDKCIVDARQWHMEDLIRDPEIDLQAAVALKRDIDRSNQVRTDMVEEIDNYFLEKCADIKPMPGATINTESPAWAIDRLSILTLKIWHMMEQARRPDASDEHRERAAARLAVLYEQRMDLSSAIDQLLDDIVDGRKYMKVYRQMKLYNDPSTNPALYSKKG